MCGLFGFYSYGEGKFGRKVLVKNLGIQAKVRGTHATGISYNVPDGHVIQKSAVPADKFKFVFPETVKAVMGHTRQTTQGTEKDNYNNHPFPGDLLGNRFSLAHNGVLDNDYELQSLHDLPKTEIKTDSYVAVQLLEKYGDIKKMAEEVSGMFTFTILSETGELYVVKNDSPIYFAKVPDLNMYVYASTEEIVRNAMKASGMREMTLEPIVMKPGQIWTITEAGMTMETFAVNESYTYNYGNVYKRQIASGTAYQDGRWYAEDLEWRCYDEGISESEFCMMQDYYPNFDIEDALDENRIESLLLECYRSIHKYSLSEIREQRETALV